MNNHRKVLFYVNNTNNSCYLKFLEILIKSITRQVQSKHDNAMPESMGRNVVEFSTHDNCDSEILVSLIVVFFKPFIHK